MEAGGIKTSPCHAGMWLQLSDGPDFEVPEQTSALEETAELVVVPKKPNSLRNSPLVQTEQGKPWILLGKAQKRQQGGT